VRIFANQIAEATNDLKLALSEPLGSTDPVAYQRAMKKALRLADDIQLAAWEIDKVCEMAAVRGSYDVGGNE
jgi:hypothetical protein